MDSATKLKKARRATVKSNISKLQSVLDELDGITLNELTIKEKQLTKYWDEFENLQNEIEAQLIDDKEIEKEMAFRCEMEKQYFDIQVSLLNIKDELEYVIYESKGTEPTNPEKQGSTDITHTHTNTNGILFTPFQDDETLTNFVIRLETFIHLKQFNKDEKTKTLLLLNALPPRIHQKIYDFCLPEQPTNKTFEQLVEILKNLVDPKPSILLQQHKFISTKQSSDQSVSDFSATLKTLALNCDFKCKCGKSVDEMFMKLQFIRGIKDNEIRIRLLQEGEKISFKDLVDKGISIELSKTENKIISDNDHSNEMYKIAIRKNANKFNSTETKGDLRENPLEKLKGKCFRCGDWKHRANNCRFANEVCRACNKKGHLARVCMQNVKRKNNFKVDTDNNSNSDNEINIIKSDIVTDKFIINVEIDGNKCPMEVDTGASVSSMALTEFKQLCPNKDIFPTKVQLKTYTGETIYPYGVSFVTIDYNDQQFFGKLFIIEQDVSPIFGREWLREIRLDWAEINSLNSKTDNSKLDNLLHKFCDIFTTEIGTIPNYKAHINLKEGAVPLYIKPRPVPYAIKDKVESELKRLESLNIITKIDNSEWGSPIVPKIKPDGSVRICADYKATINKVIKDEHYPIPRIEDIFSTMNGGKLFCTLDIRKAYLHLEMDEQSALLQTISTHKGQYKVNKLMFGVKIAPSLWQQFMERTLQDLDGVQCFFDDILIQGRNFDETFVRLEKVFERLRANNLSLNKDKCKFFQKSIKYLGHLIDEYGLHKTREKTDAILNTKRPKNLDQLRTFLGIANYYNKFIPNLATILHPLNKLLRKTESFSWSTDCENSFNRIKSEIASNQILIHFNPELPLTLATDASSVGLGAVLSHRMPDGSDKPIAFASRSLTKSERRYSQIDKEATAIYWGLKKFFPYCYGRKFILITDHKPLVSIFDPHRTLPSMTATRMFNYAHFLSGFDYTIQYRKTDHHANADYLSRFPVSKGNPDHKDDYSLFNLSQIDTLPVLKETIAKETLRDERLKRLLDALNKGDSLKKLGHNDYEYTLEDGCIFKGARVMIPQNLRNTVLSQLHVGHLGIVKMKALARSHCYWPNIDQDIERMVRSCKECCLKQNEPKKSQPHPWEKCESPWQRIHIDFAGPIRGLHYFIVVDSFSKWVDVTPTKSTTSNWCINKLRNLFGIFGLPFTLISDNAPQFKSQAFEDFLQLNGVIHKTTAPFHPSSNGQAERFVQTIKKGLKAMETEKGNTDTKLEHLIVQLRSSSNAMGKNSYELMFGRSIRTGLDLMNEKPYKINDKLQSPAVREFAEGERVQVRNYDGAERREKWKFGRVVAKRGRLLYDVRLDREYGNGICTRHVDQMKKSKYMGPGGT